jgi:PHD/YefM family antitoxin component YafN of YafNO toxin-antitoxin module
MLYKAMPTRPVSDLRLHQTEVLADLDDTPILLTHRGQGAGILVHPKVWNALVDEIGRYRRQRRERHNQASARIDAGDYLTLDEAKSELQRRGLLP